MRSRMGTWRRVSSLCDGDAPGAATSSVLDTWAREEEVHDDINPEEGGWELDADGAELQDADNVGGDEAVGGAEDEELWAGATSGVNEVEHWVRNSPLVVDHVAAESFDTAM